MSRVIGFEENVSGRSFLIYPDRHWVNPVADGTPVEPGGAMDLAWRQHRREYLDLDARIWFFTDYYSISPGDDFTNSGKRREVYGRLYRQRRHAVVGWFEQLC